MAVLGDVLALEELDLLLSAAGADGDGRGLGAGNSARPARHVLYAEHLQMDVKSSVKKVKNTEVGNHIEIYSYMNLKKKFHILNREIHDLCMYKSLRPDRE